MKIIYDKKADALNIVLKAGRVDRTVEVAPEVFVDLDKKGAPLYLEIIGVSEKLGRKNLSDIVVGRKSLTLHAAVS